VTQRMDTSTADHDRIIAQIRSLQALAESTSINEAANASYAARKLIERHRITQAMLDKAAEPDDGGIDEQPVIQGFLADTWWGFLLLSMIAESHGLACIFEVEKRESDGKKKKFRKFFVVGCREDREIVRTLFAATFGQLTKILRLELVRTHDDSGRRIKKVRDHNWQQDWGIGAAVAVQEKLKSAQVDVVREVREEGRTSPHGAGSSKSATALALSSLQHRNDEMLAKVEKDVFNIRPGKEEVIANNLKAYKNGYAKGQLVSVSTKKELGK